MSEINVICKALHLYYQKFGRGEQYQNDDGIGRFTQYCDDNGIEDVKEELEVGAEECLLCDFDPDFPFTKEPEDDAAKRKYIWNLLMNPKKITRGYPAFTMELFEQKQDYEEIKQLYKRQCPTIYNKGADTDKSLLHLWSIQKNYRFPYLQNLLDSYDRYRVKHPQQSISVQQWCTLGANEHFRISSMRNASISIGDESQSFTNFMVHAIETAVNRVRPKLIIPNMIRVNDSIQIITRYIHGATTFISGLLQQAKSEQGKQALYPFQIDLCIFLRQTVQNMNDVNADEKDQDDEDDDYHLEMKQNDHDGFDYVGDIKQKLNANGLKFVHKKLKSGQKVNHDHDDDNDHISNKDQQNKPEIKQTERKQPVCQEFNELFHKFQNLDREYGQLFSKFHAQSDMQHQHIIKCLHEKRVIAFIDRRHPETGDHLYVAEPPSGDKTRNIPSNAVPEWGISAAKTCLLPSLKKYNENIAVGDVSAKDLDEMKDDKDIIIGVDESKAKMLTVSFQAKSEGEIKAYLFWNGQTIRFFGDDIRNVLPYLFVENEHNKQCIKDQFVNDMIEEMNKIIVDTEFAKWLDTYPCEKK